MRTDATSGTSNSARCVNEATAIAITNRFRKGCPNGSWIEDVASLVPRRSPVTFLNIGANKGYSLVEFMGLWSQRKISAQRWHRAILAFAKAEIKATQGKSGNFLAFLGCGNCGDCRRALPPPHSRVGGQAHLLELAEGNRRLLRHLIDKFHLGSDVTVHNLAASSKAMRLRHHPIAIGDERQQVDLRWPARGTAA